MTLHEQWMKQALREAERAYEQDEVPVGAVVVYEGKVIGRGHNQIERLQDPLIRFMALAELRERVLAINVSD